MNNNKIKKYNQNINLLKIVTIFFNHDIINNNYLKKNIKLRQYKIYKNIFYINFIFFNKFIYEICNLIFYSSNLNKKFLIINKIFTKKNNKYLSNLITYITIKTIKINYYYNYIKNIKNKLPDILIILDILKLNKKKSIFIKKCIFFKIVIINLINNLNLYNIYNINILDIFDVLDILIFIKNNNKYKILYILYKFKFAILEGFNK